MMGLPAQGVAAKGVGMEQLMLLGADHGVFGDLEVRATQDARMAIALSVGSDAADGARIFKGDLEIPNEDAVLALSEPDGGRVLMAVADAHFGAEASHALIRDLARHAVPAQPLELLRAVHGLGRPPERIRSETTLAAVVVDRSNGTAFGLSFGDSTVLRLSGRLEGGVEVVTRKTAAYVSPWMPESLHPGRAQEFAFEVAPGDFVVAFTDGVDECHYGKPKTSVSIEHIVDLASVVSSADVLVEALAELALRGVDDHPGGQDNVAIAACEV